MLSCLYLLQAGGYQHEILCREPCCSLHPAALPQLSSQTDLLQVHPGTISTNLMRHQSWLQWGAAIASWVVGVNWVLGLKTVDQGTSTSCVGKILDACTAHDSQN